MQALEVDLEAELDVSWHIGLTERPAKVDWVSRIGAWIIEDDAVEEIEELSAKLDVHRFFNVGAFDEREIFVE